MKTISKRFSALFLTAVLALTTVFAVPFTAGAETVNNLEPVKYGLVRTGNQDRGSGNNGCITNDGGDDNMSAILWEFDLSGVSADNVVASATLTEDIWSINNTNIPNQYLDFWYSNPANMSNYSNYLNNSNYRDSSLGYGTTGPSTYKEAFGITESTPLYSSRHVYEADSATLTFSNTALVEALNKAVDESWGSIVFVAMFNEPAATTWSDIWAGLPKLSYETTELETTEFVKEKMPSYSGANLSATSGEIKFSSGGNSYSENVLYSANGNFDSNYFEGVVDGNNKIGFNIYPASSRVVYLYDEEDAVMGYPLIAKYQKSAAAATTLHYGINYIELDSAENWFMNRDWFSCSGDRTWDNTYSSQSDKAYGVYKINYDSTIPGHGNENINVGSWNSHSEGHFTNDSPITVANMVYYDSSTIDFGDNYYYAVPSVPTFRASADGCAHWVGSQGAWNNLENWNGITINGKTDIDIRVLNIKPLKDIVSSSDFKNNFNSISSNEELYTKSSLASYYDIIARIMKFSTRSLDVSDDSALESAANEIKALVDDYNTYKTPELRADFTALRRAYNKGNSLLLEQNDKVAQYTAESVRALIDALEANGVTDYLTATDTSEMGQADQVIADALADAINEAYASLKTENAQTDVSAFEAAVQTINNLDKDAYYNTSSLASATRISNILVKSEKIEYTDEMNTENTASIPVLTSDATQQNINDATRTILDALYVSVKKYTITTNDYVAEASFQNGTSTGDTSPYTATYGSTVIAHSDIDETAWYMDFSSESTTRGKQYQSFGSSFSAKVFGNINIYAEVRTAEKPNMVRIFRHYSNDPDKTPVALITFAGDSYTLPEAPAYASYSFAGYDVNGTVMQANDVVSLTGDVDIKALYTYNSSASYAVNAEVLEGGTGFSDSVAYNTKVSVEGGDNAYAWVEDLGSGKVRPFAIAKDLTFYVSETISIFAVTEEQFEAYNFSLPTINMRKDGVILNGTKVVFNGQIVENSKQIREYGVVVGVSKNSQAVNIDDVTADNAGSHENYDVIRAKSTQRVGANQFAISINGLAGKDFVYRGYVIYEKTNGEFVTVYSD